MTLKPWKCAGCGYGIMVLLDHFSRPNIHGKITNPLYCTKCAKPEETMTGEYKIEPDKRLQAEEALLRRNRLAVKLLCGYSPLDPYSAEADRRERMQRTAKDAIQWADIMIEEMDK